MIVTYQGQDSFKISQGDLVLAVNPSSKFKADITLLSTNPIIENKDSFMVFGPGEYEIKDIVVKGFLSQGPSGKVNTIYMVNFEGMNLCFAGLLANPVLSPETLENLEDIDIMFVPIGGEGVLDPAAAYKLAISLEPKVVIPTHYDATSLAQFMKEAGGEKVSPEEKLVVKKKDLDGKQAEVIVLKQE